MKELTLEITNKCSLRCLPCSTNAGPFGNIFFSPSKIEKIVDKYEDFDVVRLSGGEPFAHPQIKQICRLLHNKGKKVKILSCGVFYNEPVLPNFLKHMKGDVDEIILSYHGKGKLHEEIVNPYKDWRKAPNYSNILYDTLDAITINKIPYSFETVVIKNNFNKLEEIAQMMSLFAFHKWINTSDLDPKKLTDTNWHLLRFVKQGRGLENADIALNEQDSRKIPLTAKKLMKKYPALNITYSDSFENRKCDCGDKKAVYTCFDEEIACSALKNTNYRGKFACKNRF